MTLKIMSPDYSYDRLAIENSLRSKYVTARENCKLSFEITLEEFEYLAIEMESRYVNVVLIEPRFKF